MAEGAVAGAVNLDGLQGIRLAGDTSFLLSIDDDDAPSAIARFVNFVGFFAESASLAYETPRGIAVEENRNIVSVDAGSEDGDGRLLRLDPAEDEPEVVPGSAGLRNPWGIAVDGIPAPNPPFTDPDSDGDGINDLDDNCLDVPNPEQFDTNGDDIGDACCDISGDGAVQISDFNLWVQQLGPCGAESCAADCDGDGQIQISDFTLWTQRLNKVPTAGANANRDIACP